MILHKDYTKKSYIYNTSSDSEEAIMLINLGSPISPNRKDVKKYLSEFLMDGNVISIPYILRYMLVNGIIAPFRSSYSASKYKQIWNNELNTFPLIKESVDLAEKVSGYTNKVVSVAMRYSFPDIRSALIGMKQLNRIKKIKVLPLYPHYALSTFKTAWEKVLKEVRSIKWRNIKLECMPAFFDNKTYREILAGSIKPYLNKPFDKLIVSYHGIPISQLSSTCRKDNGNTNYCKNHNTMGCTDYDMCYRNHIETSYSYLIRDLGLRPDKAELVYQSRLGKFEWMKPYIWERVVKWADEGVENILIVCPGFIADCLETISEIDIDYREMFLSNKGKSFTYIPCIANCEDLAKMIVEYMK